MILSFMERMVCSHFMGIMNSFSLDAETSLCSWNIPDWANGVWNYTKKQNKTEPTRARVKCIHYGICEHKKPERFVFWSQTNSLRELVYIIWRKKVLPQIIKYDKLIFIKSCDKISKSRLLSNLGNQGLDNQGSTVFKCG